MSHDDFHVEPVPGLPAKLPAGEHIVWQGSPDWKAFARTILHERKVMVYFLILACWKFGTGVYDGDTLAASLFTAATLLLGGAAVILMIRGYAKAVEKTTIYTITNRRVVMRFGIALPITFNFPFAQVVDANLKTVLDDKGTLTLGLKEHTKISWLVLWPHARPWRLKQPEPSLRVVRDAERVAKLLSDNLTSYYTETNMVRVVKAEKNFGKPARAPVSLQPTMKAMQKQGA